MAKGIEYLLRNQHYAELNPVVFGEEDCDPGHDCDTVRMYYLIHYVVSGKGTFRREGTVYEVSAGQCFVCRPYDAIYYRADETDPWSYIWIGFTADVPLPEKMTRPVFESEKAAAVFRTMLARMREGVPMPEFFLASCLWELCAHFLCAGEEKPTDRAVTYVEMVKNAIETEYMKDLRVEEMAKRLHIDRSYLSTIFRRRTGMSPAHYLLTHRMKTAAMLLRERGYFPAEAARAVGYTDPCNFSRMFRRVYGVSPSAYRKNETEPKGTKP